MTNGAEAIKDNTGEDLCPLSKEKNSVCLMLKKAAKETSQAEKEYLWIKRALWVHKKYESKCYNIYP